MKKTTRIVLVLLFMGFLPVFFMDCNPCKCGDPGPEQKFTIGSFSLDHYIVNQSQAFYDTSLFYAYDSVGIVLTADSMHLMSDHFDKWPASFSFSQTAYACDCVGPQMTTLNYITAINIITQKDISMNDTVILPKGSSLNSYVKVKQYSVQSDSYTIEGYLSIYPKQLYPFSAMYLSCIYKPSQPVSLLFDVEIKMNDGKVFLFEKEELKIK